LQCPSGRHCSSPLLLTRLTLLQACHDRPLCCPSSVPQQKHSACHLPSAGESVLLLHTQIITWVRRVGAGAGQGGAGGGGSAVTYPVHELSTPSVIQEAIFHGNSVEQRHEKTRFQWDLPEYQRGHNNGHHIPPVHPVTPGGSRRRHGCRPGPPAATPHMRFPAPKEPSVLEDAEVPVPLPIAIMLARDSTAATMGALAACLGILPWRLDDFEFLVSKLFLHLAIVLSGKKK